MTETRQVVYGAFPPRADAQAALADLHTRGFPDEDLSLVTTAFPEDFQVMHRSETQREAGTAAGAIPGIVTGLGVGIVAIPGLGGLFVAGWLLTGLSGLTLGSAVGGLVGALIGQGLSESDAVTSEHYLRAGHSIVMVRVPERVDEAESVFAAHGALNLPRPPLRLTAINLEQTLEPGVSPGSE